MVQGPGTVSFSFGSGSSVQTFSVGTSTLVPTRALVSRFTLGPYTSMTTHPYPGNMGAINLSHTYRNPYSVESTWTSPNLKKGFNVNTIDVAVIAQGGTSNVTSQEHDESTKKPEVKKKQRFSVGVNVAISLAAGMTLIAILVTLDEYYNHRSAKIKITAPLQTA